jgi:hypothetical protein
MAGSIWWCRSRTAPPRKHRHRYHGVFAPNHKLRRAVTALAIGNVGKQREAATGGHRGDGHGTTGCCDTKPDQKPRSHDTFRIAWAKLMARVTHLGEPLEPPPVCKTPLRGNARRFCEPHPDGRNDRSRSSRVVRQPEERCRSAIGRALLYRARQSFSIRPAGLEPATLGLEI